MWISTIFPIIVISLRFIYDRHRIVLMKAIFIKQDDLPNQP